MSVCVPKVFDSLVWFSSSSSSRRINSSWSLARALSFRACQFCMLSNAEICPRYQTLCRATIVEHATGIHLEGSDETLDLAVIRINLGNPLIFDEHRFQEGARRLLLHKFRYLF